MKDFKKDVWWANLCTSVVHISAIVVTAALWTYLAVPVTTSFISWEMKNATNDMGCRDGNCFVKSTFATWKGVPDISLLGLVLSFHAMSFLWQFCVLWKNPIQDFYYEEMKKGRNTMRWCEYGVSAPLMIIVISAILGQIDVVVYFLLALCTSVLMGLGYLQEVHMQETVVPHVMGWALFIFTWTPLTFSFAVSLEKSPASPPRDVLVIIWSTYLVMLVLFGCFGIVQISHVMLHHGKRKKGTYHTLELKKSKTATEHYHRIEMAYAILSATAKLALGVLLVFLIYAREDEAKLEFTEV